MKLSAVALSIACCSFLPACSNYRSSGGETRAAAYLESEAQRTIDSFRRMDPTMSRFFDRAYAMVVIPKVTKGAIGVGAASGEGIVYRNELGQPPRLVGYANMTQVTVGAQLGGQSYREILFIQDAATLSRFRMGETEFAANASAVIATSGSAASNDYVQGIAVFVQPIEGVMAEAAIGGQSFDYRDAN
ncbi:MAG: hypothetical protein AB7K52_08510 [Phycisphaerales bacterium]